jgi:hypothetical protein
MLDKGQLHNRDDLLNLCIVHRHDYNYIIPYLPMLNPIGGCIAGARHLIQTIFGAAATQLGGAGIWAKDPTKGAVNIERAGYVKETFPDVGHTIGVPQTSNLIRHFSFLKSGFRVGEDASGELVDVRHLGRSCFEMVGWFSPWREKAVSFRIPSKTPISPYRPRTPGVFGLYLFKTR